MRTSIIIAKWFLGIMALQGFLQLPVFAQIVDHPNVVSQAVVNQLNAHGMVKVIIAFQYDSGLGTSSKSLGRKGKLQIQEEAIERARQNVLSSIRFRTIHGVRTFSHINAIVTEIDKADLDRLLSNKDILRIDLDEGGTGSLLQAKSLASVPGPGSIGLSGSGFTVAVIDSGYDSNHPDLAGKLVAEACFCSGDSGCCPNGASTQVGTGSAEDDNGHGTNVTGIIASKGITAPLGAAPGVNVVSVKVLDSQGGFCCSSDVVAGLNWIIANRPDVDLINMSLGTFALFPGNCDNASSFTMAYATAINTLWNVGVPVFVSAGNQGSGNRMSAPACIANAISVGAVWDSNVGAQTTLSCTDNSTKADQITCFSNSSSTTDILAPGAPTTSTGIGGGRSTFFGTSQASPLVAGCAALLLEKSPGLQPTQLLQTLKVGAKNILEPKNEFTYPRLNCLAAILSLQPTIIIPILQLLLARR